jgi:hypothetical protein
VSNRITEYNKSPATFGWFELLFLKKAGTGGCCMCHSTLKNLWNQHNHNRIKKGLWPFVGGLESLENIFLY